MRGRQLLVHQLETRRDRPDVGGCRLHHTWGHRQGRLGETGENGRRVDTADAMRFQDAFDRAPANLYRLGRSWYAGPQLEQPVGPQVAGEFQHLRIVPPQLLANAIGQSAALALQIVGHPRPLAQLDDERIVDRQPTECVPIGTQAIRQHMGVTPVVLGAGDREAVSEPVELLGVDRVDLEAALQQGFDHGPVRHFDGDGNRARLRSRLGQQPVAQLGKPVSTMRKRTLADRLPILRSRRQT